MTETEAQKEVMDFLESVGIFAWRNNNGSRGRVKFGLPGASDILGILPDGRFLAIEMKGPKTKVQHNQKEFIFNINNNNGVAFIARSIDDVIEELREAIQV